MLLSVCERLDPMDVVNMVEGVDLDRHPAWADVCEATADWLGQVDLHRRRYYLAAALPNGRRPWLDAPARCERRGRRDRVRHGARPVSDRRGRPPPAPGPRDRGPPRDQRPARGSRPARSAGCTPARCAARCDEPPFDDGWEPPAGPPGRRGPRSRPERWRPRGVLAHLTDAVVKEGGYADDVDRPRHRRYVRVDGPGGTSYQTVLAMADMPH